jgi:hypothetical protein
MACTAALSQAQIKPVQPLYTPLVVSIQHVLASEMVSSQVMPAPTLLPLAMFGLILI